MIIRKTLTLRHIVGLDLHRTCSVSVGLDDPCALQLSRSFIFFTLLPQLYFIVLILTLFHRGIFTVNSRNACTTNSGSSFCLRRRLSCTVSLDVVGSSLHDHCSHTFLRQCHIFHFLHTHRWGEFRVCVGDGKFDRLDNSIIMPIDFSKSHCESKGQCQGLKELTN